MNPDPTTGLPGARPASPAAGRRARAAPRSPRQTGYHALRNPFTPQAVFSEERVAAIHDTALRVLQ